jgi:hypothetical protein
MYYKVGTSFPLLAAPISAKDANMRGRRKPLQKIVMEGMFKK